MTAKAVTTAQLEQVRKMAREKGICKDDFQKGLNSGVIASALDKLKAKPQTSTGLLTEVATVDVPAVEKFVAADNFGPNNPDGINFCLWSNFKNNFLGKIEKNVPAVTLVIRRLNRSSVDEPIRQELTPEREETALAHFYELIRNQPRGEHGKLPTDGTWIIAYVKDADENFWAVVALWLSVSREWVVGTSSVGNPSAWGEGSRVVSRK